MTLTCGLLEAAWVDVISLDIRQNIFQHVGGQILDHKVVGSPSLEILRAQLDQVLCNLIWLAWLGLGHANVPPNQQYLVCGCFCDMQAYEAYPGGCTDLRPKSTSNIPFYSPVLKAGEILNPTTIQVAAFIYLRVIWLVFCECCT